MGFPGGSDGKEFTYNTGDVRDVRDAGLIPGSGKPPGEGNGNPLQCGEFHEQRSLVGYRPWDHKRVGND